MDLGDVVNPAMKLFEGSFPNTRTAEGTEVKAEVIADVGDLKKLPFGDVYSEPFLNKGDVCGISTDRPENSNAFLRGQGETRYALEKGKSIVHNFQMKHVFEGDGNVLSTGSALTMSMKN